MKKVIIYTDGACKKNPGPGGWGAVLIYNDKIKEISGGEKNTTNNQMELQAAISALSILQESCEVQLYSDSKYLIDGVKSWLSNWKKNSWQTSQKKSVKNRELWERIDKLFAIHKVDLHWVRGHSGDKYNERADYLANIGIDKL